MVAGSTVALWLGGHGDVVRHLSDARELLRHYPSEADGGKRYLEQVPVTSPDRLVPEDLAVTLLLNSRVGYRAYVSVQELGPGLDLGRLPDIRLEDSTPSQRASIAEVIAEIAQWRGFAASVTTKLLHKKRPRLVPILDNQAIFGAYLNRKWPQSPFTADSVKGVGIIQRALDWISHDLTRPENAEAWSVLSRDEPSRSRIELFDMVWWSYFRQSK